MPKRSSKKTEEEDFMAVARRVVEQATGGRLFTGDTETQPEKNPAAVALGRLGGLKGGNARAKSLTAAKRKMIAKRAAAARWSKEPG